MSVKWLSLFFAGLLGCAAGSEAARPSGPPKFPEHPGWWIGHSTKELAAAWGKPWRTAWFGSVENRPGYPNYRYGYAGDWDYLLKAAAWERVEGKPTGCTRCLPVLTFKLDEHHRVGAITLGIEYPNVESPEDIASDTLPSYSEHPERWLGRPAKLLEQYSGCPFYGQPLVRLHPSNAESLAVARRHASARLYYFYDVGPPAPSSPGLPGEMTRMQYEVEVDSAGNIMRLGSRARPGWEPIQDSQR